MNPEVDQSPFVRAFRGTFKGVLRWEQLDALWARVRREPQGWYLYAIGEPPPSRVSDAAELLRFIDEIDALLRQEHTHSYCGIVYVDDLADPELIKIFDPNNLGVSCGFSDSPPLPGWVMSKIAPLDLAQGLPSAANRQRWWARLFGG